VGRAVVAFFLISVGPAVAYVQLKKTILKNETIMQKEADVLCQND
jgi:hypothetical protein